ncbi:hypothetical protein [Kordia periserrulae]|uniref:hypothetical protein n=1 Tax=Kordia periserrulae TaxID=701523 RepID=UPI000D3C62E3|nr:hypothetical protein [Kordia periserrulae]
MKLYIKYALSFLKACLISLIFGACWVVTFVGFDRYATANLQKFRNDFFFDVVLFFLSGLVGAFFFYVVMVLFRKLNAIITQKEEIHI